MKKFGFVMPDVASPLPTPGETQVPVYRSGERASTQKQGAQGCAAGE